MTNIYAVGDELASRDPEYQQVATRMNALIAVSSAKAAMVGARFVKTNDADVLRRNAFQWQHVVPTLLDEQQLSQLDELLKLLIPGPIERLTDQSKFR